MAKQARVRSSAAIAAVRTALQLFESDALDALASLRHEASRAREWVTCERPLFWAAQVRAGSDDVAAARIALERKEIAIDPGEGPSCYDEKKQLERARLRLRIAEEKVRQVRQLAQRLDREAHQFEAALARLLHFLETELPRAVASLGRMEEALAQYAEGSPATPAAATNTGAAPEAPAPESPVPEAPVPESPAAGDEPPGAFSDGHREESD